MSKSVRRVVTGHNAAGKSIFVSDGATPHVFCRTPGSTVVHELWETSGTPADNQRQRRCDPARRPSAAAEKRLGVPHHRISAGRRAARGDHAGRHHARRRLRAERHTRAPQPRHAGFHKTDTIDYAIVLSGEIYALMDEGEVLLKTGDVLIQRGTNHAWSNRTDASAYVAFVLIDADPV